MFNALGTNFCNGHMMLEIIPTCYQASISTESCCRIVSQAETLVRMAEHSAWRIGAVILTIIAFIATCIINAFSAAGSKCFFYFPHTNNRYPF